MTRLLPVKKLKVAITKGFRGTQCVGIKFAKIYSEVLINMDAMTTFAALVVHTKVPESKNKGFLQIMTKSHSIVSDILTVHGTETPIITTRKNKTNALDDNDDVLSLLTNKTPKIAYITVKKNKKCLTFDYCCVRNNLQLKMKKNKRRYIYGLSEF